MHIRAASAALLTAAALAVAPASAALAAGSAHDHPGSGKAAAAKARATAHRLEHRASSHRSFVLGGKATAVDATAGTVTFTVHGTRFKALRGSDVTVSVTDTTKVSRRGHATLADVLVGDKVVVRARQLDLTVTKDADGSWTLEGEAVAVRLVARPTRDSVEPTTVDPSGPPATSTEVPAAS